jgi:hypothetical protein
LSVCKPLNEIIQSDEVHEVEEIDINGELIMEENVDETTTSINFTSIVEYLDQIKFYALQRKDKSFSNKMYKLTMDLENLVFEEPKTYKQTLLHFYDNN